MDITLDLSRLEVRIEKAAYLLHCSPALLRKLEALGVTPPARRDEANRRIYTLEELEAVARTRAGRRG